MRPDGISKAGAIVSIVFAGLIIFVSILCALAFGITAIAASSAQENKNGYSGATAAVASTVIIVFFIIYASIQIPTIVLCSLMLKGKLKSNIAPGVVALILSGLIGGILILCGKME
ncbi:hypothetical protein [Spiroplasma turonicum]|uniref:Transmembrane protein n=1 Tax=Spiroplasma turonicum TaxID=216946 RepID=A0A0K1P4Q0_9MOLU|nr:hypothetical protein [Spiroplasma turonicum]AKU79266.1 hypothetical protein STURON_0020 [Spiroplasma turonicum]ALX70289.1 hypothetical protein STURO_v1c00200 [Spiroplasma turonicum]